MPQVPTYDTPQNVDAALPSAKQESLASPALLGAGAEKQIEFGRAVQEAGSGLSAIAYHMDQRAVADGLFKSTSADKEAFIAYQADVLKNRQGNGATGVTKDTAAWWKERISKNLEGMDNTQLKRLYQQHAGDMQNNSLQSMSHFEVQQTDVGQQANFKADTANTINLVAANPSDDLVRWGRDDILKKNKYMAAQKNWSPEVLEAVNIDALTNMHKQVIQTLAATNKDKASSYFEAHKDEIAGAQRAEIGELAMKATAAFTASAAVDALWGKNGPHSDTDQVNIDTMAQQLRDQFKDNTYTRDAALTELKQRRVEFLEGVQSRMQGRTAAVYSMFLEGKSLAAVQQTSAWASLTGTEQYQVTNARASLEATQASRAAANENRAFARENRAFVQEQRAELRLNTAGLTATMSMSDPDRLVALTRDQVINLAPTLGTHNTQQLLGKWDALTKDGTKLSEARIDNDQFRVFAAKAGLDITPNNDAAKERIITLRNSIDQVLGQEQMAKKRPLSRDERDALIQKQLDNTVLTPTWMGFGSGDKVPSIALKPDDVKSAYVEVNGQKVNVASIPATDRAAIIRARQQSGLPVTEQAIAEMYVRKNSKKPVSGGATGGF
jgi:hypothetical protein